MEVITHFCMFIKYSYAKHKGCDDVCKENESGNVACRTFVYQKQNLRLPKAGHAFTKNGPMSPDIRPSMTTLKVSSFFIYY